MCLHVVVPLRIIAKLCKHFQTLFPGKQLFFYVLSFPPVFLSSALLSLVHMHTHTDTQTHSQSNFFPWHRQVRSLDAYLTAFTCYHAVMDAWWFVSTDLAGNYFDLSCREKKGMKEMKEKKKSTFCCHKLLYNTLTMDPCWYMKEHCASKNISSGGFWILTSTEYYQNIYREECVCVCVCKGKRPF